MPLKLGQLDQLIRTEYARLIAHLGIEPLPLDIYEVDESGTAGSTTYGTNKQNATPAYTRTHLVLPVEPGDLAVWTSTPPHFPPSVFDRHSDEWPAWRTELWHEVVHQYQQQRVGVWDPKDDSGGHTLGWPDAIHRIAGRFGIGERDLLGVL